MTAEHDNAVHVAPPADSPSEARIAPDAAAVQAPPIDPVDPELRTRLIRQFEQWLDQTLAAEPPPKGLPPELLGFSAAASSGEGDEPAGEADLYSVFSALTALTGETRLQGRAFKQLSDLLGSLAAAAPALAELPAAQRRLAESMAELTERMAGDGDELAIPGEQVGQTVIDLYDRLDRGLGACRHGIDSIRRSQPGGMLWRWAGGPDFARRAAESAAALYDACALLLARIQSAMQEWRIERIGNAGEPFDPRRMAVVDVRRDETAAPGTVVEVLRSGYAIDGTVRSVARVAVAGDSAEPSAKK